MGIIKRSKRKFRPLAVSVLAGFIGLAGLSLAPAATAATYESPVQVIKLGQVSKDYWDYYTYRNTSYATAQECVAYAESKLRMNTWAQCVYIEYQGQKGWYPTFMGVSQ